MVDHLNNKPSWAINAPAINPFGPNSLTVEERIGAYRGALASVRAGRWALEARLVQHTQGRYRSWPDVDLAHYPPMDEDMARHLIAPGLALVPDIHKAVFGHTQVANLGDLLVNQYKHRLIPALAGVCTMAEFPALVVAAWRHATNLALKPVEETPSIVTFCERLLTMVERLCQVGTALIMRLTDRTPLNDERELRGAHDAHHSVACRFSNLLMDGSVMFSLVMLRDELAWLCEQEQRDLSRYHLGLGAHYDNGHRIAVARVDAFIKKLAAVASASTDGRAYTMPTRDELTDLLAVIIDMTRLYFNSDRGVTCNGPDFNPE
jgi:hypothetical protein